jgi:hypothetical protein
MSDRYHIQVGVTRDYKRELFNIVPESDWDHIAFRNGYIYGELIDWRWPAGDPIVKAMEDLIYSDEDFYLLSTCADGQEFAIGSPWDHLPDVDIPEEKFTKTQKFILRVLNG